MLYTLSYEEMITFDHYLLIAQILMNFCQMDPIRLSPMKRLMLKKDLLLSLIMTSMKRFCVAKEYEYASRYSHFYSQYILLTQDKLYGTRIMTDPSMDVKESNLQPQEHSEEKAEEKPLKRSRPPSSSLKKERKDSSAEAKERQKKTEDDKDHEQTTAKEEDPADLIEEMDHQHYQYRICISCLINSKLIYCLMAQDEYEAEIVRGFRQLGLPQFLSSSFIPPMIGEVKDTISALYSERWIRNETIIPHPVSLYAEDKGNLTVNEKAEVGNSNDQEDKAIEEKRDALSAESQSAVAAATSAKVYLIPIMDLSDQLLTEINRPPIDYNTAGNKMGDSTLRREELLNQNTTQIGSSDPKDPFTPAATNDTAAFDSKTLFQQLNHTYYLNRNIEMMENIEQKEFDFMMSFLFQKFHLRYFAR